MSRFFLLAFLTIAIPARTDAFSLPDAQSSYSGRCIQAILNCSYSDAIKTADSAAAADSTDPLAPVIRLAAIGVQDVDFDMLVDSAAFFNAYRIAETRIHAFELRHGESSYSKLLLGICKALHSSFYLHLQSYYSALQNGFSALDLLSDAYKADSTNGDALLFLGLYDYARGELKKRLWWVLFWYPGSKTRGIARLEHCEKNGQLTQPAALFALAEIYIREDKPDLCAPVIARLERDFPKSRFVLWEKAKYLESRRLYYEAALTYELLASSYDAQRPGEHNALVTRNLQAHQLVRAGQKKDAAEVCRMILSSASCKQNKAICKDTQKMLDDL
jgi:hypothetical protein